MTKTGYNFKANCHVCGRDFLARYNVADRARVCTPPDHVCWPGMKGNKKVACIERCCRSRYRRGSSQASMDNPIDPTKFLSDKEYLKFLAATKSLPDPEGVTLRFIAATGCRLGEALLLRASNVRINGKVVMVRIPTLKREGRPERTVDLWEGADIVRELRVWVRGCKSSSDILFPVARRTLQRVLEKILDRIKPRRGSLVHILRHTHASQLIAAGADWNYVRMRLGWSSLEMARIYAHTTREQIANVLGRLPK